MSPIKLNGSTSGFVALDAPAAAGSNTLVLPTGNGSSGQYLQTNGSGTLSWSTSGLPAQALTAATSVSASGTSIDFTSIPSTVKRITVMFNGVSTNGTSSLRVQIGSGSIDTSGYASTNGTIGAVSVSGASGGSAGWDIIQGLAADTTSGRATIALIGSNTWIFDSTTSLITRVNTNITAGHKTALSGTLDRVRITTVNGTDTFDAGSINIMYEG